MHCLNKTTKKKQQLEQFPTFELCSLNPQLKRLNQPLATRNGTFDWSSRSHTPLSWLWSSIFNFRSLLTLYHFRRKVPVPRLTARCLTEELSTPMFWPSPGLFWRRAGRPMAQVSWPTCWTPSARLWRPSPPLSGRLGSLTCKQWAGLFNGCRKTLACTWEYEC